MVMAETPIHDYYPTLENHTSLVGWVQQNGGFIHPDVEIAFAPNKGFHTRVLLNKSIHHKTRIASCPTMLTISFLNVLNVGPFKNHGTEFPESVLLENLETPELLQIFFLMEQHALGENSWWAPYIKTLPSLQNIQDLRFESEDDLKWLEGTNLKAGFASLTTRWQATYHKGLRKLKEEQWPNAVNGAYTWELFQWAATIFGSRSFSSRVLNDALVAASKGFQEGENQLSHHILQQLSSTSFAVLLPLVDIANHRPATKVEWQAHLTFVGLEVLEKYESGQEIYNNYGPRDNEALLLSYGFTLQDNPFDHFAVRIGVPPGSPVADARSWTRDSRSESDGQCYIFNTKHPRTKSACSFETSLFSYDLLDAISLLTANDRELETMYTRQRTLMSFSLGRNKKFEDHRNLLSTLTQLLRECEARVDRLRTTTPDRAPVTTKQAYAKIYRDSQLSILETAVDVCKFSLTRACTGLNRDKTLNLLKEAAISRGQPFAQNVETLLQKNPIHLIPQSTQLMSERTISTFFSKRVLEDLDHLLDTVKSNLDTSSTYPSAGDLVVHLSKVRFTLLIASLYALFVRDPADLAGIRLPNHKLRFWMNWLLQRYPVHAENQDQETQPNYELEVLLDIIAEVDVEKKGVPTREAIIWAWTVVEEEAIRLPHDLLESISHYYFANRPRDYCNIALPEDGSPASGLLIYMGSAAED